MLITTANHDCSGLFRSYVTSSFQGIGRCLCFFATFFFFCHCQLLTSHPLTVTPHPQSFQACNLCFYVVTLDVAIKYSCIFSYTCVINVKGFLPGPTLNPSRSLLYVPTPYCILFLNSCKALDFFLSWLMPCSSWELFSDSQYCKPQTHCEQVWAKPAFRLDQQSCTKGITMVITLNIGDIYYSHIYLNIYWMYITCSMFLSFGTEMQFQVSWRKQHNSTWV